MSVKKGTDALTSMRFFAAFLVFADHYIISFYAEKWALALGYVAMTFFFTLSGFVLAYAYVDDFKSVKISKLRFYIGRFARVWPLHVLCLGMSIPFVLTDFETHFCQTSLYLLINVFLLQDIIPHTAGIF